MSKILYDQPTKAPTRKLKYGQIAALISALVMASIVEYAPGVAEKLPEDFEILVAGLVATGIGALVGYFTQEELR